MISCAFVTCTKLWLIQVANVMTVSTISFEQQKLGCFVWIIITHMNMFWMITIIANHQGVWQLYEINILHSRCGTNCV